MHLRPIELEREQDGQRSARGFLGLSRLVHARDGLRRFLGLGQEPGEPTAPLTTDEIRSRLRPDRPATTSLQPTPEADHARPEAMPQTGLRRFLGLAPLVGVPSSLSRFLGLAPLPAAPAERFDDLAPVTGAAGAESLALAPLASPAAEPRFLDLAPLALPATAAARHVDLAPLAAAPAVPRFIDLAPLPLAAGVARHVDLAPLQAAASRNISLPALASATASEAHRLAPIAARGERFVGLAPLHAPMAPPMGRGAAH
ncbi:hypothetical protein [Roseomonas sp. 18066]|uniref:hypothetical protein n=1 Tax=Roseomonas sp. 18066 TaxID=2681412 RepID=UPI00135975E1|nr:hypothetical protein [Roseomonas sp. 18066]